MEYTLQTLRSNTVFADRDAAVEFLDTFRYHMNGQPVCVRYYDPLDHNNYQCLFAVGLKNGNGEDAGPEYYHIIEGGTLEQVQSDWTQTDATQPDFIQHKPDLAAVATSGSYNDLTDTPELADIATTGSYNDLRDVPLGDAGGIAELDSNGKVPSSQLPCFVDDVIEAYYNTSTDRFYEEPEFITLITPSAGKSWVDISTNKSYRWTGSVYVRVDEGVQLGVTANTAYRGDRGKIAYDHATDANRNTTAQTKKLYKMSVTSKGHVGQVEESTAETDIANLQENVEDLDNGLFKGGWRTPISNEWNYVLNTRSASTVSGTDNARFAKAQINSVNGLILLPDVFELPSGITLLNINATNATAADNTYTTSQWETLENAGCIFLPCSGYRNGTYMSNINSYGFYSSSQQAYTATQTVYLFLHSGSSGISITYTAKRMGKSVRLIKENTEGAFSISSTLKADIAKSNLQFHCLNKQWRFAPNAYDIIGSDNANIAENYNGYIDLFGFGTSGWNSGAVCYQPWSSSTNDADYINHDLTGDYKNADWGVYNFRKQLHNVAFTGDYNDLENKPTIPAAQVQADWNQTNNTQPDFIKNKPDVASLEDNVDDLNSGKFPGGWRTPTADELTYIINTRPASTVSGTVNARYTKAQINGVNGLILLPDVFELPAGITMLNINIGNATASDNTYTISQWETLENAGCIFLPCSGYRNGTYMSNINSYGFYSSTTQQDSNYILYLFIHSSYDGVSITSDSKHNGKCVRLIKENTTGGFSISSTLKADIAKSNLQFHCLNKEWRFAPNAYDIIGSDNANIAENYNGYIDLFGFGTSGWNSGAVAYQPWSSDWRDTHYINHNLMGNYKNADWGVYNFSKQLQPVAFTGDYNDLDNKPIPIPTTTDEGKMLQVNASGQYELVTIVNSELQPY